MQRKAPEPDVTVATASAPDGPFLRLEEISKSFGGVQALRGASLEVRSGEVLSLVATTAPGSRHWSR